jgi:hypothetical protein
MRSKWFDHKETAISMRQSGMSMTTIGRKLGIPRSTLSGWFRSVELTDEQREKLASNSREGWRRAREKAVEAHRAGKALRLLEAKRNAQRVIDELELSPAVLDLAFAFLYLGEGAKKGSSSLASSDPMILRFVIAVLKKNYGVKPDELRCDLHLRMDQDADTLKSYWAAELKLSVAQFRYVAFDKRSAGQPTYDHYKGVCVLYCGSIAIQRKLIYLYNLFCEKVAVLETGM